MPGGTDVGPPPGEAPDPTGGVPGPGGRLPGSPAADAPDARPGVAGPAAPRDGTPAREGEPSANRRVGRGLLALAGVLVAYYVFPVDDVPSSWDVLVVALGLLAGLAAVVYVVMRQVRMLSRFRVGDRSVRLDVLALAVFVVVPLFALGYYAVEAADPGQFQGLRTKSDALYFTVSTLVTVGFGDVHATGQLARVLVIVQMAFDVVFVAAAVSVLTTQMRARAAERHGPPPG